jgi:hypothetical protein
MRKRVATLLILFFAVSCILTAINPALSFTNTIENNWASKAPMQEARGRLGVAALNGKIYAIGGSTLGIIGPMIGAYRSDTGSGINTTEEYDSATDTWIYKTPMPTPRCNFGIAVYEGKIYCLGGSPHYNETDANEVYDPATDTWDTKASIPIPTGYPTANVVEGKIYLISTKYSGNDLNQVYDPGTNSWATKASPPTPIGSMASAVFNSKIYFINIDGFLQIYDPLNDSWSIGERAPSSVPLGANYSFESATAAATTGMYAPQRIYFFGENGTHVYDPVHGGWTIGAAVLTTRGYAGVAVINDTFFVVGGITFQYTAGSIKPTAANEQYTPFGYGTAAATDTSTWLVYGAAIGTLGTIILAGLVVYFKKYHAAKLKSAQDSSQGEDSC